MFSINFQTQKSKSQLQHEDYNHPKHILIEIFLRITQTTSEQNTLMK